MLFEIYSKVTTVVYKLSFLFLQALNISKSLYDFSISRAIIRQIDVTDKMSKNTIV